jgi:hypothetical protein
VKQIPISTRPMKRLQPPLPRQFIGKNPQLDGEEGLGHTRSVLPPLPPPHIMDQGKFEHATWRTAKKATIPC